MERHKRLRRMSGRKHQSQPLHAKGLAEIAVAFGSELQLERETRNISLASIAEGTKVPQRHLRALELEEFEHLPGGVFTKGIVRSYCNHLGLDVDEWLQRLPEAAFAGSSPDWVEFAENIQRNRIRTHPGIRLRWWGVVLMLASLGGAGWVAWTYALSGRILATLPGSG